MQDNNTNDVTNVNKKNIIRVSKNKNNPYVQINRTVLNDTRLSWKAKGMMAYMLSMPDDWVFYREELIKHSTDGKDSFNSGFKELEKYGYVKVTRIIGERGRVSHWETVIYETPPAKVISVATRNGFSTSGLSRSGESATTNTDTTKTDVINNHNDHNDFEREQKREQPKAKTTPLTNCKARIAALGTEERYIFDVIKQLKGMYVGVALKIVETHAPFEINNVLEYAKTQNIRSLGAYLTKSLYEQN